VVRKGTWGVDIQYRDPRDIVEALIHHNIRCRRCKQGGGQVTCQKKERKKQQMKEKKSVQGNHA